VTLGTLDFSLVVSDISDKVFCGVLHHITLGFALGHDVHRICNSRPQNYQRAVYSSSAVNTVNRILRSSLITVGTYDIGEFLFQFKPLCA